MLSCICLIFVSTFGFFHLISSYWLEVLIISTPSVEIFSMFRPDHVIDYRLVEVQFLNSGLYPSINPHIQGIGPDLQHGSDQRILAEISCKSVVSLILDYFNYRYFASLCTGIYCWLQGTCIGLAGPHLIYKISNLFT
jgi:hypothetical protein